MQPETPPPYLLPPPVPAAPTRGNRKLVTVLAAVTAALAVLCCGGAGGAAYLLRPRDHQTITLPSVRVHESPDASPPAPTPPAPLEADHVFQGRGNKSVPLPGLSSLVHMVVMTHRGSSGFAVNGVDGKGAITELLGNGYGKYQGTMLLDGQQRPAALQVRASGAWKLVVRDARRAPLWTGRGSGTTSSVLRVEPAWTQPLVKVRYSHRGSGNFVISSYGSRPWDLLVNEIGRQDGETKLPAGTRYIEIEADGAWTFARS